MPVITTSALSVKCSIAFFTTWITLNALIISTYKLNYEN
jgi:hypothetical protein